uniref:MADF domain-containing protein n=1 Tax=Meloidogyne incognita TaxID=6306 RepID=A0A914KJR1_MELIC
MSEDNELDNDHQELSPASVNVSAIQRQLSAAVQAAAEEPSFNLRLIEAVKQSHCLYDPSDRQYRSADYKIKVWNRLVQMLGFQGDARTLYNRWKQLRDKYGKEKKKLKYSGEQHSQWQYFKYFEFLDPHMVDRTQTRFERNKEGKNDQQQIVITDPNFTLHLIDEVRLQPCLYDIKDPKYRHSEYRNQAWGEIAKNLSFPGDISSLYKQWKKVRDRYVREKRKLRMAGNGSNEVSNWEFFRDLMWIDPFLDERAAQVKRKRESSEASGGEDEQIYLNDSFSSSTTAINFSNGINSLQHDDLGTSQMSSHHSQQQQIQNPYTMMSIQQQQQQPLESIQHPSFNFGHQLQQLVRLQQHPPMQNNTNSNIVVGHSLTGLHQVQQQHQNLSRIRPASLLNDSIGLVTSSSVQNNSNQQLMIPLQQQQSIPLNNNNFSQLDTNNSINVSERPNDPTLQKQQQHLILPQQQPSMVDGERAFAHSVVADLLCLPEHARIMAKAQIQHLLENSKITIVKA